jgi:soluble lytic murein transglycosylase-like protein
MNQITENYAELKVKYDELRKQKAKYEEVQDLLQELELRNINDMKDYIQARYSKVPQELAELIAKTTHDKCIEHGADFATVVGIMEVESAFNPFAVSHADARGLMQVLPKVWMEPLGISDKTDFHDISVGIDSGIRVYLQYLQEQKGDIKRALNQYNGCSLDKGPYAPQIFEAIGRFTAYRNNSYTGTIDQEQNKSTEETEKNGRTHKSVPN